MDSRDVARRALELAISTDRETESLLRDGYAKDGMTSAAVDFGGNFIASINKAIEHTIVAARRSGVIGEKHNEEGAVAGAAKEALGQVMQKALGLNVGGKIAVVRSGEHIGVAVFFGVGLVHLNEVAVGLGHRVI